MASHAQTIRESPCPTCGAAKGEYCRTSRYGVWDGDVTCMLHAARRKLVPSKWETVADLLARALDQRNRVLRERGLKAYINAKSLAIIQRDYGQGRRKLAKAALYSSTPEEKQ